MLLNHRQVRAVIRGRMPSAAGHQTVAVGQVHRFGYRRPGGYRPWGIGRKHRPRGIGREASAERYQPRGIGRGVSAEGHRPGGIGRGASAEGNRPRDIGRGVSALAAAWVTPTAAAGSNSTRFHQIPPIRLFKQSTGL